MGVISGFLIRIAASPLGGRGSIMGKAKGIEVQMQTESYVGILLY